MFFLKKKLNDVWNMDVEYVYNQIKPNITKIIQRKNILACEQCDINFFDHFDTM